MAGRAFSVFSRLPFLECREILLCQLQSAVVIAAIAVNVMQMTSNQVVHVIAVGNYLVSATCAMLVTFLVALANVMGSTTCRVGSEGLSVSHA